MCSKKQDKVKPHICPDGLKLRRTHPDVLIDPLWTDLGFRFCSGSGCAPLQGLSLVQFLCRLPVWAVKLITSCFIAPPSALPPPAAAHCIHAFMTSQKFIHVEYLECCHDSMMLQRSDVTLMLYLSSSGDVLWDVLCVWNFLILWSGDVEFCFVKCHHGLTCRDTVASAQDALWRRKSLCPPFSYLHSFDRIVYCQSNVKPMLHSLSAGNRTLLKNWNLKRDICSNNDTIRS